MAEKSLESAKKLSTAISDNIAHKDVLRKDAIHLFKEKQFYQYEVQQKRLQQVFSDLLFFAIIFILYLSFIFIVIVIEFFYYLL